MSTLLDPFAGIPDANPADVKVYARPARTKQYVDPLGDSSKKRKQVNLNPQQTKWFERQGWGYAKTEWRDFVGKKHDIWTFGDWLALDDQPGAVLVQTTTQHNAEARLKKAEATPELRAWLERGNRFEVHGWHKPGRIWEVQRTAVILGEHGLERRRAGR